MNRREMILTTGAAMLSKAYASKPKISVDQPVAVVQCDSYDQFKEQLKVACNSICDLKGLVSGKTVALKINLAGDPRIWPSGKESFKFRSHPGSVEAMISLLADSGARRVYVLESFFPARQGNSLWARYCLRPDLIHHKGVSILWKNIQNLGSYKHYVRKRVHEPLLFPAYHLSPALFECDVYVSMAKLKEHCIAGISMSMKNNFGITPCSLYGGDCGPSGNEQPTRERADVLHNGFIPVPKGVDSEVDAKSPRDPGYRIPRIVVDLLKVRPIDLAVVDGVDTVRGGEGPWIPGMQPVHRNIILVGRNAVNVDAVGVAVMGYGNPAALLGVPPFVRADNVIRLAQETQLGSCDLGKIEIRGECIDEVRKLVKLGSLYDGSCP